MEPAPCEQPNQNLFGFLLMFAIVLIAVTVGDPMFQACWEFLRYFTQYVQFSNNPPPAPKFF